MGRFPFPPLPALLKLFCRSGVIPTLGWAHYPHQELQQELQEPSAALTHKLSLVFAGISVFTQGEETTRALSSHKRVLLIPQGWLKRLEKLLREETSPWSNPDGEAKPGERLDGHLQGTVWQNHPEVKSCLVWGRGVKFPAGFIQDALCSWCPVIHHPERGGCCLSMCAGPQNDDFPFLLQVFWRGRAEGDAKRREKKELRWVLREYKL